MYITVKKLSPGLLNDFLHFFDHVAFADHEEWSGCYCVEPHLCEKAGPELPKGVRSKCREYAIEFIKSGKLQGYLAYAAGGPSVDIPLENNRNAGDEVVGWCNANDKRNYEKVAAIGDFWTDGDLAKRIKSIVCFAVAANVRQRGVATALLKRVCDDALAEGYEAVEAYPYCGARNAFFEFAGPVAMYERQGFAVLRASTEMEKVLIMRKNL